MRQVKLSVFMILTPTLVFIDYKLKKQNKNLERISKLVPRTETAQLKRTTYRESQKINISKIGKYYV